MKGRWWVAITAVAVVSFMSGCAASRSTLDVPAPQAQPSAARAFVKITEVRDLRRFEASPANPATPSLEDPVAIRNPAVTSAAIGRKRSNTGKGGDAIYLPGGRTVEQIVRATVSKALAEQGYAVVDGTSPHFNSASPVQLDIELFWAWFTPAFAQPQAQVQFRSMLILKSEALTGRKEAVIGGNAAINDRIITDTEWRNVIVAGMDDLVKNTKAVIKPAP
jgi:hypothetical protein